MTSPLTNFTDLAHWLVLGATTAADIAEQNHDLVNSDFDKLGQMDRAVSALENGDLLGTVAHLDAVIKLALKPVTPPTTGRNKLERFQFATGQRDDMRRTALIARVLVLDAIKAGEVSA